MILLILLLMLLFGFKIASPILWIIVILALLEFGGWGYWRGRGP